MRLVIDTNMIISSIISNSTRRHILMNSEIEFIAPEYTFTEILNHADMIKKKENRMIEIDMTKKPDGSTIYMGNVRTVINSGRDMNTGDITNNPAQAPEAPEKKRSLQDILANPATIASFIVTLAGILLSLSYSRYAVILVIIGILIFVFLVILNSKKG